jgi:two-component system response regulator DesR
MHVPTANHTMDTMLTMNPLTWRLRGHRVIVFFVTDALSGAQIARQLKLSEGTVRNYLSESIGKLGARNRAEAARTARQKGWL